MPTKRTPPDHEDRAAYADRHPCTGTTTCFGLIERLGQVLRTLRDRLLQRELSNDDLRAEIQEIAREAGLDLAVARRLDPPRSRRGWRPSPIAWTPIESG